MSEPPASNQTSPTDVRAAGSGAAAINVGDHATVHNTTTVGAVNVGAGAQKCYPAWRVV